MGWVKYSTVGAKAGTDLKDSAGNLLDNDDVKNTSITLNAAGYLNNIGTQEKLKNALITMNTNGTLNFAGSGSGAVSKSGLSLNYTDGADITGSNTAYDTSRVNGTTASTVKDGAVRANTGLDANGKVTTGLISGGVTFSVAEALAVRGGFDDLGSTPKLKTANANTALKNDQITINANGTLSGAGSGTPSLASIGGIVGKTSGGFGESLAGKTGAPYFSSAGNFSFGTIPAANGGTGITNFANSTHANANVTTFERNVGDIFWSNLSGNMTPAASSFAITITWRDGDGGSLGTSVVTVALATSTTLALATIAAEGAEDSSSMGAAANAGVLQTTTVTKNSVVCTIRAQVIDGSGWSFK